MRLVRDELHDVGARGGAAGSSYVFIYNLSNNCLFVNYIEQKRGEGRNRRQLLMMWAG